MTRATPPQWSFADLEFRAQNITLDPLLQQISDFIEQHQTRVEPVRQDLQRGLKNPATGRNGLDAPPVLRSLALMRVKNWDYRELRQRIADGYSLRPFTEFFSRPVPQHDAFHRAFAKLTPATLEGINQHVVLAAVALGLEDGKKLRTDTPVVETDIHHPTDSTWLWDTVRVISRLVGRLDKRLPRGVRGFTNHRRSARRLQPIQPMSAQQRHHQLVPQYRQLIRVSQRVVTNARRVLKQTEHARGKTPLDDLAIQALRKDIEPYCQLGDRVIDQARRRVLEAEPVPTDQKIYSIFESHTDLIKRGKTQKPIEFGHKVFLAESSRGLITQYRVLEANPADEHHVEPSLQRHQKTFGQAPEVYGADRGFYSPNHLTACQQAGVQVISIPQRGGKKTPEREAIEKSPAFKKGQRFRAGIAGRISVLFRGRGRKRCLAEGRQRFELFVGAAVLANNLLRIAALLRAKRKPPHSAAA